MAIELYPHNEKTYKKMTTMFKKDNRVGIVQPTGTGKSFIILKWIEDHPHDRFVVLSPSLEIFMQFVGYAKETGDEALLDSAQMLSYQTLIRMTDEEINQTIADKIVVDEFHRTGATQWGPAFMKLLAANPNAKVLGASATPVRYLDGQRDMAEELFDRNLAVEMTLGDAVQEGILPIPRLIEILYDVEGRLAASEQEIAQRLRGKERKKAEMLLEKAKRELAQADGAEVIFQKYMPHDHGKFIVFCRNKEHLQEMKKTVPKWLRLVNKNVRCYVSISAQEDKDIQLWAYVGDNGTDAIKLLFTIDRLNEGLHAKGTDGVIMLRPTTSPIIYLQQMGRALAANKKSPIIFDMVNNFENVKVMHNGEPTNVLHEQILRAGGNKDDIKKIRIAGAVRRFNSWMLQMEGLLYPTNDAIWEKMFSLYVDYKKEFGKEPVLGVEYKGMNLGMWCHRQRGNFRVGILSVDRIQKLQTEDFVFEVLDEQWEQMFACAKEYFNERRNLNVPQDYKTISGDNLGAWVSRQRQAYKNGTLSKERRMRLEAIGMVWSILDEAWEQCFEAYVAYKKEFGKEPARDKVYNEVNIGAWISRQRVAYKTGRLSEKQQKRLESIGILWDVKDAYWEKMFACAMAYFQEHGDLDAPLHFKTTSGENLGLWISGLRKAYKNGKLSAERQERLEAIGMVWDSAWEQMFACAKEYFQEHGDLDAPLHFKTTSGENLGAWVSRQRQAYKNGTLSKERRIRLEAIGMVWVPRDAAWEEMFACAQKFFQEYGNLSVPSGFKTAAGENLGMWVRTQREVYKKGKLSTEHQKQLESIGMVWNTLNEAWERGFNAYVDYKKEFGKEPANKTVYKEMKLGVWCFSQRRAFREGLLSAERLERLLEKGFVFNLRETLDDQEWQQKLDIYVDYKNKFAKEPTKRTVYEGISLGSWCYMQRKAYKSNKLSDDKIQKLRDAGFPFDSKK